MHLLTDRNAPEHHGGLAVAYLVYGGRVATTKAERREWLHAHALAARDPAILEALQQLELILMPKATNASRSARRASSSAPRSLRKRSASRFSPAPKLEGRSAHAAFRLGGAGRLHRGAPAPSRRGAAPPIPPPAPDS